MAGVLQICGKTFFVPEEACDYSSFLLYLRKLVKSPVPLYAVGWGLNNQEQVFLVSLKL